MKRKKFIIQPLSSTVLVAVIFILTALMGGCSDSDKPDSNINGVKIGVISYSWWGMPCSAEDILDYCLRSGIGYLELMGDDAERYAGIPPSPPWPENWDELSEDEIAGFYEDLQEAREKQREWRLSASMDKYEELGKMFSDAGVDIHIVKFSPSQWTDEEIDYAFEAAKAMGAQGITDEIGEDACKRLGKFAEKHDMLAIYHNHEQGSDPEFSFKELLEYSPKNRLNFDIGNYYGATGKDPAVLVENLNDRIFSIHLKDKTGKFSEPPGKCMPFGEGETPVADVLLMVRDNKWPIHCDIEVEYEIPEGSDAVRETARCLDYCRGVLL